MDTCGQSGSVGLSAVSQRYGSIQALKDIDLTLSVGTTVLLGRNGAGKSTLGRILTGVERPSAGSVARDGQCIDGAAQWRAHHRRTGWLPQSLSIPSNMTVEQYLRYAAWLKEVDRPKVNDAIAEALRSTDLTASRTRRLGQLSGGTLRRVGIAQAIVHDPTLLILDEPTVGLDPEQRSRFHEIVRDLSATRCALLSTHLLEDVEALASRVIVLDEGEICFDGTVAELEGQATFPLSEGQSALRTGFLSVLKG